MQSSGAVGHDSEGSRDNVSSGAGLRINVQGFGAVVVTLWKKELGGNRVDAQVPDDVTPLVGATDQGDDGETWVWWRVVVSSSRGGNGLCRAPPNRNIHKEVANYHSREGGLPACLCIVHGGGEDSGDDPDGALVVSRGSKRAGGIIEEEVYLI